MWTKEQKAFCVEAYLSTKSLLETRRKFIRQFNARNKKGPSDTPSKAMIMRWVKKFRERGTVLKQSPPGPAKSVRTQANSAALKQSVQQSPTRSTRHRSQALGIKRTSLMRLLKESNLKAYRLSVRQKLIEADMEKRVKMAQWFQENPEVCERTWFSDEAHFWLCGHVNSRNAVYWSDKRPDIVLHKPLHSTKVTVWAAMRQGQPPIGPFFFEDENEEAVTITAERYINLALTPFWEAIRHLPGIHVKEQWFQQDGATPHTANATMMWL